jgi:hypothetical protein
VSITVRGDDNVNYFLLEDASYNYSLVDREKIDGVNDQPIVAVETLCKIKNFCRLQSVILLPAHDPGRFIIAVYMFSRMH